MVYAQGIKDYPKFEHHGAVTGVTGSCHRYLATPDLHFLVDCGLFQGHEARGDTLDIHRTDFDFIESTYGNRLHENRETCQQRLREVLGHALENGGTVTVACPITSEGGQGG